MTHWYTTEEQTALRQFVAADYTRLDRLELVDDCYTMASKQCWPLDNVSHLVVDNIQACSTFPFLPYGKLKSAHLVFETARKRAWLRLGNDDWTYSRSCAIDEWNTKSARPQDDSYDPICGFYVNDSALNTSNVQSITVTADLWPRCGRILDDVYNLKTIRIVLKGDTLPTFGRTILGRTWSLAAPSLGRLVFRGEPPCPADGPIRVTYRAMTKFAREQLHDIVYAMLLCLENVELTGEPDDQFEWYFKGVETWDPKAWSYLSMRERDAW
ncbi:hypothetical protein AURDEDRAFT_164547 [Auricularia subglabra TFB-10046 SS5]|nr:hypothetical protein AURDEDRAFT_164547 [Auricularia subglabra TFB-10046 SS5]